jgi:hypothetical protein
MITKEQWRVIEDKMSVSDFLSDNIAFTTGGHKITVSTARMKMRLVLVVWVDGELHGTNVISPEDGSIYQKVYRKVVRQVVTGKKRADLQAFIKACKSKKHRDWAIETLSAHHVSYTPFYNSAKTLCATLRKNCPDIELLES